ncbi:MAG: hypothetical protein AAGG48_09440 [Planctomycetota bacterium]
MRFSSRNFLTVTLAVAFFCAGWIGRAKYDAHRRKLRYNQALDRLNADLTFSESRHVPFRIGSVISVDDHHFHCDIGFDDGVRVEDVLSVYRGDTWLGQARVVETEVDRSNCVPIGFKAIPGDLAKLWAVN